jgi:hypothetical protein
MAFTNKGSMPPAPAADNFVFDFSKEIGVSGAIESALWGCSVEGHSAVADPDASSRILGSPAFSSNKTTALIGNLVEGCLYLLETTVTIDDGRVFVDAATLQCMSEFAAVVPVPAGVVPFDYSYWLRTFPELSSIGEEQAQGFWEMAGVLFRNDYSSPEPDFPTRAIILNALTAHMAASFGGPMGGGGLGSTLAGAITSKSVNGVSVGSQGYPGIGGTQLWYLSTRYGALFWKLTAAYRTMHYIPGPSRFPEYGGFPLMPYGRRFL